MIGNDEAFIGIRACNIIGHVVRSALGLIILVKVS